MLSITIPLWMTLTAVALPVLCFSLLCVRFVRVKRSAARSGAPADHADHKTAQNRFADHVHHQIQEQQIDAVFDALAAVIETERLKLKALTHHSYAMGAIRPSSSDFNSSAAMQHPATGQRQQVAQMDAEKSQADRPMSEQVAELADNGMAPEQIARRLGLSKTEVALAIKIQTGRADRLGFRMEAVA